MQNINFKFILLYIIQNKIATQWGANGIKNGANGKN